MTVCFIVLIIDRMVNGKMNGKIVRLFDFSCFAKSRAATCAFLKNLARSKFSYENRLVLISRESYEILVCERWPTVITHYEHPNIG